MGNPSRSSRRRCPPDRHPQVPMNAQRPPLEVRRLRLALDHRRNMQAQAERSSPPQVLPRCSPRDRNPAPPTNAGWTLSAPASICSRSPSAAVRNGSISCVSLALLDLRESAVHFAADVAPDLGVDGDLGQHRPPQRFAPLRLWRQMVLARPCARVVRKIGPVGEVAERLNPRTRAAR
jgi:hypothetical protein